MNVYIKPEAIATVSAGSFGAQAPVELYAQITIPEPSTTAIMGFGLALLGMSARRYQYKSAQSSV